MKINYDKLYDISMLINHDMPVYKGKEEKRPLLKPVSDFASGTVYESKLEMNLHTGTHLDRTLHMIPEGNTIETLDFKELITKCKVLDLTSVKNKITAKDLSSKDIADGDFILLKTRNSYEKVLEGDFIYLEQSGAEYLVNHRIKGVGIDALGIERAQPSHETHLQLMEKGIHILEGLRLKEIEEGEYLLFALPVNIEGAEAAPVRAVLMDFNN
ncbi:cyclase family protein [Lacrimispora amygdalina]|uniref:Kynurenine formamidase n=1 Tax=Lacrimispora amygdalina TaxID=253257 RepID=A0A3E2NGZ9_9FIRM|nr:cyclase family protein [Clostridium indicum]RFZ80269.1 cyclase family protein [Clostridium indicum]